MNPLIVMPSIRPVQWEYLEPVNQVPVLVVDDTGGKLLRPAVSRSEHQADVIYADRNMITASLPAYTDYLIPEHNPSCKDFGLYYGWKNGFDPIILLDDDVDLRTCPSFLEMVPIHRGVQATEIHAPYAYWNPMIQLGRASFYVRGFPYEYRHVAPMIGFGDQAVTPLFNEGLWMGTPDINGIDKLGHEENEYTCDDGHVFPAYVFMPPAVYTPISIMNIQIARELIPAFYQPPDFEVSPGWRIRRHDDVWSGLFLQILMHLKGDTMTVGLPWVVHTKAGDMLGEIKSENCTNLIQPYLLNLLRQAVQDVEAGPYWKMAVDLSNNALRLLHNNCHVPGRFFAILGQYFNHTLAWAYLFKE